jgi:hypothetical protein
MAALMRGMGNLPRLRWLGGPLLGVARVLAQVSSRSYVAGNGLPAHSGGFLCNQSP